MNVRVQSARVENACVHVTVFYGTRPSHSSVSVICSLILRSSVGPAQRRPGIYSLWIRTGTEIQASLPLCDSISCAKSSLQITCGMGLA